MFVSYITLYTDCGFHHCLFCRHPIPDYYSITLEISRDRITSAHPITCDSSDPKKPKCPSQYNEGDNFLFRTLNEACTKMVSFTFILKQPYVKRPLDSNKYEIDLSLEIFRTHNLFNAICKENSLLENTCTQKRPSFNFPCMYIIIEFYKTWSTVKEDVLRGMSFTSSSHENITKTVSYLSSHVWHDHISLYIFKPYKVTSFLRSIENNNCQITFIFDTKTFPLCWKWIQ